MKTLIKVAALFIVAISLAACQKAVNPVSPSPLNKTSVQNSSDAALGTYSGTFEYIPDTKSPTETAPLSGTIHFVFDYAASTYKYDATFNLMRQDSYVRETSESVNGEGNFERQGTSINLVDSYTLDTTSQDIGFRLDGDYHYLQNGNQITIEGRGGFGFVKIVLNQ